MQLYSVAVFLHILGGSLALLSGPMAMYKQDAGRIHQLSGKTFYWSMMLVSATGLTMSVLKSNFFLLMIAVFSFYMAFSGRRALQHKKMHHGVQASRIDWAALVICGMFGLGLASLGGFTLLHQNSFGITPIVFGSILLLRVFSDYRRFTRDNSDRKTWLYVHIGNMIGAYIAAFTAFLVQNVQTNPAFIAWLMPTVLFVPFIFHTIRKFKKGKPAPRGV